MDKNRRIPERIVVVGAGGNGSWLSFFLAQYMSYDPRFSDTELVIVDHDRFEEKNKSRQFFSRPGNKAESLVGTLKMRFGDRIKLVAEPRMVVDERVELNQDIEDNLGVFLIYPWELISVNSVVFLCVDKFYPRLAILQRASMTYRVCVINGGTGPFDWGVDIYIREKGRDVTRRPDIVHPELVGLANAELAEMLNQFNQPQTEGCTQRMETDAAGQTFVSNLSTATLMFQTFVAYLEGQLTVSSYEGGIMTKQGGLVGPGLRMILPGS